MKKLIFILLFSIIATASFAQAAAASARMFKDANASGNFLRNINISGYISDTAEQYALIRFTKDCKGHANWQYLTSDISNIFASIFPIIGRTDANVIKQNYPTFQTNTRYFSHDLNLVGSPTLNNNAITFNGTTQYAVLRYFRTWNSDFQNITPQFLMDSILNVSPTDTLAQTNMNLSIYMKDSADNLRFGANNTSGSPQKNFRILKVGNTFQSVLYDNSANGILTYSLTGLSGAGLFTTSRNGLTNKLYINGLEVATNTNGSYNFSLPRETTTRFEIMASSVGFNLVAGTVQYLAILRRGLDATEQLAYYNSVKEYIRRKTQ
jgi:hypothetical protein